VIHHLVTIVILVAAIALYTAGAARPATVLLLLGVLAEATFWYRLSGKRRQTQKKPGGGT
jgi:hypothetical protein